MMSNYKKTGSTVRRFLLWCFLFIAVLACNNFSGFNEYKTIQNASWHKDSILTFQIAVTDTLQQNNLFINVRNDINYKYSNLWLFIEINQPGENKAVIDTFEITLADERGKWLGGGFGGVKNYETLYKTNVYFPSSGKYEIKIKQGMRGEKLKGITQIGLRIEKP